MDGFKINSFERVCFDGKDVEYTYNTETGVISVRDDLDIEDYVRIGMEIGHAIAFRESMRMDAIPLRELTD